MSRSKITSASIEDSTIAAADIASGAVEGAITNSLSHRNVIINGGMDVWQRGTSFSSNVYTADRWKAYAGSGHSISRSTDVPSGSKYSLSFTGTGDSAGIRQNIEGKNCTHLASNDVTVSFYLKQTSGAGTGVLKVALAYATAEDNFGGTNYISQPTIDTSSSWTKYTLTYSSIHADSKNGLQLAIKNAGTGTVTFLLSQVQLELGSVATPFEHKSYGEELALCQRYFHRQGDEDTSDGYEGFFIGAAFTSALGRTVYYLPVKMRTIPTFSWSGSLQTVSGLNVTALAAADNGGNPAYALDFSASGMTTGYAYEIRSKNDGDAYIEFDAEL